MKPTNLRPEVNRPAPAARRGRPPGRDRRLKLVPFINRSGTESWRVVGNLHGERIRMNFDTREAAEGCRHELEQNRLAGPTVESLRSTWLTDDQLRIAEGLFHRATGDELATALSWWERHGKEQSATAAAGAGMAVMEAVKTFKAWLPTSTLRSRTRANLANRVGRFALEVGHAHLGDLTADSVDQWLAKREVSPASKDNDRRALSRFFAWCMERPRRWMTFNPCAAVRVQIPRRGTPSTFHPDQCRALMSAAANHKDGRQVRHLALLLFGGVRPEEASKMTDADLNLADGEIRIRAEVSKTHRARTVPTGDTPLADWLKAFPDSPIAMSATTRRRDLLAIRKAAGIDEWPEDVLRHTAASALIRRLGSYATVADRLGNSESILRKHYVGGWPSNLADSWNAIRPVRKKALRAGHAAALGVKRKLAL